MTMINQFDEKILVSCCQNLVASYKDHLTKTRGQSSDPLDDLRKRLAKIVEAKFKENGERWLIIGCMHKREAGTPFLQTQTSPFDLYPKEICQDGDHSHLKYVAIDQRSAPDETIECSLGSGKVLNLAEPMPDLHRNGPDFARRNFTLITHIHDFKYVKAHKIYIERVPFFEIGPALANKDCFGEIGKLLDKNGVLAFDYVPFIEILNHKYEGFNYFTERQLPKARDITEDERQSLIKNLTKPGINQISRITGLTCSHKGECPMDPCDSFVNILATHLLQIKVQEESKAAGIKSAREEVKNKPKAVLSIEELAIGVYDTLFNLNAIPASNKIPWNKFGKSALAVVFNSKRKVVEMESLLYQVECYRSLPMIPELENEIHAETKQLLDKAMVKLVEEVVFPQFKHLGFEPVSFSPNGRNEENGRVFSRVIYLKNS